MLAVPMTEAAVQPWLGGELALAGVNGSAMCVVAGPVAAVQALEQQLLGQNIACRRLQTSHAFHSRMMDPIVDSFVALVRSVRLNPPEIHRDLDHRRAGHRPALLGAAYVPAGTVCPRRARAVAG